MKPDQVVILASDHIDPEGSVVHSGMALADAAIELLEAGSTVEIVLVGVKGASSSYFNVFLRRIEEACGLPVLDEQISLQFGSKIQKMVYDRSLASMKRGPRKPTPVPTKPSPTEGGPEVRSSLLGRILQALARNLR